MTEAGRPTRTVALDNAGTLSDLVVVDRAVEGAPAVEAPVPAVEDRRLALVNLGTAGFEAFADGGTLGAVIDRDGIGLQPVLGSRALPDPDPEAVRAAVLADRSTPARAVHDGVAATVERVADGIDTPEARVAIQLVVDLDAGRVCTVIGYAPVVRAEARACVDRLAAAGVDPHVVSGDAGHVLTVVAGELGIEPDRVHGDCSPAAKARRVERLRAESGGPVAMVGDYVNDRAAFETADFAVLIDDGSFEDGVPESLLAAADVVVDGLPAAVDVLEGEWTASGG